jgi:hypothetical protein
MAEWLDSSVVGVVVGLAILAVVVTVAAMGVQTLRDRIKRDDAAPGELLTNFRDLHERGGLSDAEFRTIKTALGSRFAQRSNGSPAPDSDGDD